MVQIIENWADIKGSVRSCATFPAIAGFVAVDVLVEKVNPVEGFANLLGYAEAKPLSVLVPEELVKSIGIAPGDVITCRVRRAGLNRVFVHRNHLSVHRSV